MDFIEEELVKIIKNNFQLLLIKFLDYKLIQKIHEQYNKEYNFDY